MVHLKLLVLFQVLNPTSETEAIRIAVQFLQSTLIPLWAIFAIGTDCIFVGIGGNLIAQYRMLNKILKDLDFGEGAEAVMGRLRVCVNHHNFLNA